MSTFSALTFEASVLLCMLSLYAYRRKSQYLYYKNIAQKNAADFMQIDETKIPASYDGQPGKCLGFSSFIPIDNSKSFTIYVSDQKPILFSFNGNIFFEVSNIHILTSPFQNVFYFFNVKIVSYRASFV